MKVAVIGPLCTDENTIIDKTITAHGGVTFYTSQALSALGVSVTVYATFNPKSFTKSPISGKLVCIKRNETHHFSNIYPTADPDVRIQKAKLSNHLLTAQELPLDELKTFDAIVLGPLYYNDFHPDLIKNLSKKTYYFSCTSRTDSA